MDLRSIQNPFKESYRADPAAARLTLIAQGSQTDTPLSCSIDIGRAIYETQAHRSVGGARTGACSGDLLPGARLEAVTPELTAEIGRGGVTLIRADLKPIRYDTGMRVTIRG